MASNPPQLQLSLGHRFKRSLDQFFDLESPLTPGEGAEASSSSSPRVPGTTGVGSSRGHERKRARSSSSLSDGNDSFRSSRSSTFSASSDTSLSEDNEPIPGSSGSSTHQIASLSSTVGHRPPRLPTPDIYDLQDIEIPDYTQEIVVQSSGSISPDGPHVFNSEIDRSRSRSPSLHSARSPTPPPVLPPLSLPGEDNSADIPFLHSPTAYRSEDRLPSGSEDPSFRGFDAPPRLPSPIRYSSPTLSDAIPASALPPVNLIPDQTPATDSETVDRLASLRERLSSAVELLQADNVSAFRDEIYRAWRDGSATLDSGDSDVQRSNGNTRFTNGRDQITHADLYGSSPSLTAITGILAPPTNPFVSSASATSSHSNDIRLRPVDPSSASDDGTRNGSSSHVARTSPEEPSAATSSRSSSLSTRTLFSSNQTNSSVSLDDRQTLARWFEDPAPSTSSGTVSERNFEFGLVNPIDPANEWAGTTGRSPGPSGHVLPQLDLPSTIRGTTPASSEDNDAQDREDEDIIVNLLSTRNRMNHVPHNSSSRVGSSGGRSNFGSRTVSALGSLMERNRDNVLSSLDDDDVIMQRPNSTDNTSVERPRQSATPPMRYSDVLTLSDYRSQVLADARRRRRYIAQGLLPENYEEHASSGRERRYNGMPGTLENEPSSRSSTARPVSEAPRWQFSWNDAFSLGSDRPGFHWISSDEEDEEDAIIRRELNQFRRRRFQRPSEPSNRSSLFGGTRNEASSSSRNQPNPDSHRPFYSEERFSSSVESHPYRRIRPLASTRPGPSNSLVAENAAEIRRRSARADLMEHLFSDNPPEPRSLPRDRAPVVEPPSRYPSLPPLPYQYRSPSPVDFPRSVADVLDAADRESEAQESRSREEELLDALPRRSSLTWLPPPRFEPPRPFSNSLAGSSLFDSEPWNSSDGMSDPMPSRTDWLRRRLRPDETLRPSDSDGSSRAQAHSRPTLRSTPWARARNAESSDSFSSSISDIARTINHERSAYVPSRPSLNADIRPSSHAVSGESNNIHHRLYTYEEGRRLNSVPSIPPPDLGALFSPGEIPTSPFDPTYAASPSPEPDMYGRLTSQRNDVPFSHLRPSLSRHRAPSSTITTAPSPITPYPNIDVESFTPGPFRSTLQRFADQSRSRNTREAPSIPPLRFEEDLDSFPEARSSRGGIERTDTSNPHNAHARLNRSVDGPSSSSHESYLTSDIIFNRPSMFPRHRPRDQRGSSNELHEAMTRRARLAGSLIERSASSESATTESLGGDESFNHAIEVLRHDGLSEARSQQLINRFRERRDVFPTYTSAWGDIENDGSSSGFRSTWRRDTSSSDTTRMGNTASRRQASPVRNNFDGPEGARETRPARSRATSRFERHRISDLGTFGDSSSSWSDFAGRSRRPRSNFSLGDYMRDEDFDHSYEGLMSLAATLGEVKPRATPDHVVAGLETGFYKYWAKEDSDKRCPICLDDYKALDQVLKLNDCCHWLHKGCLEQWLKGANTCPVCRKSVAGPQHRLRPVPDAPRSSATRAGWRHIPNTVNPQSVTSNSNGESSTVPNAFSAVDRSSNNQSESESEPYIFRGSGSSFRRFQWQPPSRR